ncbi:MAG: pilus assembly protein TadE [Actinomyces sp.]|nr:pilus assembly protein TadE [Actinomyces sp.]
MKSCDHGYVTVEHAIGFLAVTAVIGVIVAVAQAGLTGASLCQAVREGARAASIGQGDPQAAAPYRGAAGWVGGVARCSVTTIDEGALP